ncbi:heavy-metal-associated domain-containing protein [Jiulongibacter sp. NS-SX5]|uniref:heavy-metal-associated domain-containing protein n=1 Tax=Jiulongibacter sp. NS-SX5 TaxID=3463854 RepID=UPI00405866AE
MRKLIALIIVGMAFNFGATAQDFAKYDKVIKVKTSAVCKMCKERIERDLSLTKGVEKAILNLDDKVVTVAYNEKKTSPEKLKEAISKIGYDADEVIADQKAHDRLPDCCQKDVKPH